jgi:N-acetylglucosaminyldiphosphoundecaprenol N-acetyl-beta-D-mannosaminyltransferase
MDDLPERVDVAGQGITSISSADLIDCVATHASSGDPPRLITYVNAWVVCLANDIPDLSGILRDQASIVHADGQAVVWASRLLGRPLPERVNAGDLWPALLARLGADGASIYLLGGDKGIAEKAAEHAVAASSGLRIVGARDGYFDEGEGDVVADDIRRARPSVLFVGMGSPRQERWAARHLDGLGVPVVWCVGALFEYYAGQRSRAPVWARRCGLEWCYRLALEPRRLWRRYTVGNLRFMYLVLRQLLSSRRGDT